MLHASAGDSSELWQHRTKNVTVDLPDHQVVAIGVEHVVIGQLRDTMELMVHQFGPSDPSYEADIDELFRDNPDLFGDDNPFIE